MKHGDHAVLSNVVQILINGTQQYEQVAKDYQATPAYEVLQCIIKARHFASDYLEELISRSEAQQTIEHAFGSVLHKMYPAMLERLPKDFPRAQLHQLLEIEDTTCATMHDAVQKVESRLFKCVLKDLNPRLNGKRKLVNGLDQAC